MAVDEKKAVAELNARYAEKYGFFEDEKYAFKSRKGIDHEILDQISDLKGEPEWMRQFRHRSLDIFYSKTMPDWGGDLGQIDFDDIYYYIIFIRIH